jgi:hypothetical protein
MPDPTLFTDHAVLRVLRDLRCDGWVHAQPCADDAAVCHCREMAARIAADLRTTMPRTTSVGRAPSTPSASE